RATSVRCGWRSRPPARLAGGVTCRATPREDRAGSARPPDVWSRSRFDDPVHGVAESRPLSAEHVQHRSSSRRQRVIATWWAAGRFAPGRLDHPFLAEPREQGIQRAFGGHQAILAAQLLHQFDGVALAVAQKRQHAEFEHAAAELRGECRGVMWSEIIYHASQGTW